MELNKSALDIILKMKPYPDGSQLYPRYTKGEPVKRYIYRITCLHNGAIQISGTAGTMTYYDYSQRDAERLYNRQARTA